jgi:hypothetical protein
VNIEDKIYKIIKKQVECGDKNINDLSKIGLTKLDYSEFIKYSTANVDGFNETYPEFLGVPVFLSNSDGSSRAYFKGSELNKSIGIIGSAGRGSDVDRLGVHYWNVMLESAANLIEHTASNILISGGAAWADHIAVSIFLKNTSLFSLHLHLPCPFKDGKFEENTNVGKTANHYHALCSSKLGVDTLSQIQFAIEHGCKVTVSDGFYARNYLVSEESDILLAYTFGDEKRLKDGGTKHTFDTFLKKKSRGLAFHYNLNEEKIYTY